MGQHTWTSAVLLCAQLGGSENSWKHLQCLKIPRNPSGLEAEGGGGGGGKSSSALPARYWCFIQVFTDPANFCVCVLARMLL